FFFLKHPPPPCPTLFPYTTLFRSALPRHPHLPGPGNRRSDRDRELRLDARGIPRRDTLGLRPRLHRPVREGRYVHLHQLLHARRSEEHTSELQSQSNLVCRLLLEK